jgi:hypothetical protein
MKNTRLNTGIKTTSSLLDYFEMSRHMLHPKNNKMCACVGGVGAEGV